MIARLDDEEIEKIYSECTNYGFGIQGTTTRGLQRIQIELQLRILDALNKNGD